jgi:hypothetical protein
MNTVTVADKAVPLAATPFAGAVPLPYLNIAVQELAALLIDITPVICKRTFPVLDGVKVKLEPKPIITAVVLCVPVGLEGSVVLAAPD